MNLSFHNNICLKEYDDLEFVDTKQKYILRSLFSNQAIDYILPCFNNTYQTPVDYCS